jgi:hypothetical protein
MLIKAEDWSFCLVSPISGLNPWRSLSPTLAKKFPDNADAFEQFGYVIYVNMPEVVVPFETRALPATLFHYTKATSWTAIEVKGTEVWVPKESNKRAVADDAVVTPKSTGGRKKKTSKAATDDEEDDVDDDEDDDEEGGTTASRQKRNRNSASQPKKASTSKKPKTKGHSSRFVAPKQPAANQIPPTAVAASSLAPGPDIVVPPLALASEVPPSGQRGFN